MFKWFVAASKSVKLISIGASAALIGGAIAIPAVLSSNTQSLKITTVNASATPVATKTKSQERNETSPESPTASSNAEDPANEAGGTVVSNPQEHNAEEPVQNQPPIETYTLCIASAGDRLYAECTGATCAFDVIVQGGWNWGAAGGNPRCNQDVTNYLAEHCNQLFIDTFDSWRKDVLIQRCEQYRTGTFL